MTDSGPQPVGTAAKTHSNELTSGRRYSGLNERTPNCMTMRQLSV